MEYKERTLEEITDFVEDVLTGIRTAERIGFRYMTRADHLYPGATPATDEEEDDFIFGDGSDECSKGRRVGQVQAIESTA